MKYLKMALVAACAVASTSAIAGAPQSAKATAAKVSTCYYVGSYITPDAIYDVYECYGNGDGSY